MQRIGIIGAGDVVRKGYLPALSRIPDCKVVAISSRHGESARELAASNGIEKVYANFEELLTRADIDSVFICTPTHLHREIAEAAMKRQLNVLLEKPLCTTYEDSRLLLRQAATYSGTVYVAFNTQFREENRWLKSRVLKGEVGKVELLDFQWFRADPRTDKTWLHDKAKSGGGVLMDLGAHLINLALLLVPSRSRYTAYCSNLTHALPDSSVEDTSASLIEIDDRVAIAIRLGWDMKMSTKSRVILDVFGGESQVSNKDYEGSGANGFGRMIHDFFRHVDARTSSDLRLADDTMQLLDALYRSSRSRSVVAGTFVGGLSDSRK